METASYNVYKKSAALQVKFIRSKEDRKPNFLFLEMAKGMGDRKWDWDHKITFKLGERDLMQVSVARAVCKSKGKLELIHDPDAGKSGGQKKIYKSLRIFPGEQKHTYGIGLAHGDNKILIFLDMFEMKWLEEVCVRSIPFVYKWSLR